MVKLEKWQIVMIIIFSVIFLVSVAGLCIHNWPTSNLASDETINKQLPTQNASPTAPIQAKIKASQNSEFWKTSFFDILGLCVNVIIATIFVFYFSKFNNKSLKMLEAKCQMLERLEMKMENYKDELLAFLPNPEQIIRWEKLLYTHKSLNGLFEKYKENGIFSDKEKETIDSNFKSIRLVAYGERYKKTGANFNELELSDLELALSSTLNICNQARIRLIDGC